MLYYRRLTSEYFPDYTDYAAPSDYWPDSCWLTNYRWDSNCGTDLKYFNGWSNSLNNAFSFQMCGSYKIMGGYNQMGSGYTLQKVFSNLPSHSSIEINFDFMRIDSWDGEALHVSVDGVTLHTSNYIFNQAGGTLICGAGWLDSLHNINVNTYHSSSSATINIWTTLDQVWTDESFGIRNFVVYLYISCSIGCLTCSSPNYCTSCPYHSKLVNGICYCKNHYYMKIDSWVHCHPCYVTCKNCNSMEVNACNECYEGYVLSSGSCVPKSRKNTKLKKN